MTNAADLASEITRRLPDVKRGSLVVYGDIFGGRIDNIHVVTSATVSGNPQRLVVGFNEGETLEVWDPDHAIVSAHEFRINNASRVRWEWLYYGRPKVADNRYFIEHVRDGGGTVVATTNADWVQRDFKPRVERPAVELIGMF
ncbi:MAG: hypothetical protein M3Y77_07085 [Actinomycetota bacterium]|nr:hypothetical protein [Actinomycetota bacterium]